jgi:hypothetical protein
LSWNFKVCLYLPIFCIGRHKYFHGRNCIAKSYVFRGEEIKTKITIICIKYEFINNLSAWVYNFCWTSQKNFFGARKQNFLWSFYVSPHNLVPPFIFPSVTVSSLTPILLPRPCMHCIKVLRYRMIRRSLLIANVIYQTLTVTTLPFHHFLFYFSRLIFFLYLLLSFPM